MGLILPKQLHPDFAVPGRQPQGPVEIDWEHPLARQLIFASIGRQEYVWGASAGRLGAGAGYEVRGGKRGVSSTATNGTGYTEFVTGAQGRLAGVKNFTIAVGLQEDNGSGFAARFKLKRGAVGGANYLLSFEKNNGNNGAIAYRAATNQNIALTSSAGYINAGGPYRVYSASKTYNSALEAGVDFYRDGLFFETQTKSLSGSSQNELVENSHRTAVMLGDPDVSQGTDGFMDFGFIWSRALTAEEHRTIGQNPYVIFKPAAPIYLAADAGKNVAASTEALTLTTYPATITVEKVVQAATEQLTLTTYPAAIDSVKTALGRRSGGFIPRPVVYLDEDGNPVSMQAVKKRVVQATQEAGEGADVVAVRKAADRVLSDLTAARAASERDIERIRSAIGESKAAVEALERAIEAQREEEAALALLLH